MKYRNIVFILFALTSAAFARNKVIEKHFQVKPSQVIQLKDLDGAKVSIKTWDKDEIYVKLKVNFRSSDDEYEENVIKSYDVVSNEDGQSLVISTKRIGNESTWSHFLGIKFRFMFYESSDSEGEIYVPRRNPLNSYLSYCTILLEDMKSEVSLIGTSNKLALRNCSVLKQVANNYGETRIEKTSGSLSLRSKSGNISVIDHAGALTIEGDYSNITLDRIKDKVSINSVSGKHNISNIGGDLYLNSNYSTIRIENVNGFTDVTDKSGSITVRKTGGLQIKGDYSDIDVLGVSGKSGSEIIIKGQSGKLKIEDAAGKLTINNPYSSMFLKNIKGDVELKGTSSSITAESIDGSWESSTQYSKLLVKGLSGRRVKVINKSDPVTFELLNVPSDIDIQNEYGGVNITMPEGFSGDINMDVAYGKIHSNIPVKIKDLGGSAYAAGKIGSGSGKIKIETKSSNITLTQK
ncbi:MAG: hypothetical protein ACM34K_06240 [Bacillota bacterium]